MQRRPREQVNHTALSLASSFRIASGTSSPGSFVDTRSGEGGAEADELSMYS